MKAFYNIFIFLTCCVFFTTINSAEIISECFVSPNYEDFDCHSSSVVESSPQKLCAVWKGGPGKGFSNTDIKQNVGIWFSTYENGKWNLPEQIVSAPNSVCWSPILVKHPHGKLFLFYRVGSDPRHTVSLYKCSFDEGLTWSNPAILPAGIVGPTKSKPIFDREGNMYCGSSVEVGEPDEEYKATACWVEIFSKEGVWSKYGPIEIPEKRFGGIEPALFWGSNGTLKMLCRDRSCRVGSEGWICTAESVDKGKTWTELRKTTLPNPDSGIDVLSCGNGLDAVEDSNCENNTIILCFNNSHRNRYPLTLALSEDCGNTWTPLLNLEEESGEFPSVTMDWQGYIHVTYAHKSENKSQRRVKHVVVSLRSNNKNS